MPEFLKHFKWGQETMRALVIVSCSVFIWGWQTRGTLDDYDKRVTLTEKKVDELNGEIVRRDENEAHWQAMEKRLDEISKDVRDLRKEEHDYFSNSK